MKSERLVIETPEKIIFTYKLAEIGTRTAAYLIDCLIQLGLLLLFLVIGVLKGLSARDWNQDNLLYYLAVLFIMMFLFQWGYFLFFEAVMNGRTPGKKVCRLRVIRTDGERLDFQSLVIRNLLRAADSLPLPYFNILGGFVAILNKKNRRIGDFAAGTVVVSDSVFNLEEPDFETKITSRNERVFSKPSERDRLSEKDLYILRRLINERSSLSEEVLKQTTAEIAEKLRKRYNLVQLDDLDDFALIEEIYKAHTYEDA